MTNPPQIIMTTAPRAFLLRTDSGVAPGSAFLANQGTGFATLDRLLQRLHATQMQILDVYGEPA